MFLDSRANTGGQGKILDEFWYELYVKMDLEDREKHLEDKEK